MFTHSQSYPMNDFKKELMRRVQELREEQKSLRAQIQQMEERSTMINGALLGVEQLLRLEGITVPIEEEQPPSEHITEEETTLAGFLYVIMSDHKYYSVPELVDMVKARGYDFGSKHEIKSVNFTLMGLSRSGDYERRESDKRWRYIGKD